MSDIRVASRYAKSVFELANETQKLEAVHNDMVNIKETIEASRELELLLKSPIVNVSKKRGILDKLFGSADELTRKFFTLLVKKGRESYLYDTAEQFHLLYNKANSIEMAQVITPFALTDELRESFKVKVQSISGKKGVELKEKVDESLIGGYILRVGGQQIDDSVRSRLRQLTTALVK